MQPVDMERNRQILLRRKAELQHFINSIEESGLNVSLADSTSELSSYDNHPGDLADETFERSKDLALRENANLASERIDAALEAMENGTYGTCQLCGKNIDPDRLAALPEATTCAACSQRSQEGDRTARPVEEDVINPPFNIQSLQDFQDEAQNQTIYDGEDTWQDVARYGSSDGPQDQPDSQFYPNIYVDEDEDRGSVDYVDSIPYRRGKDGMIYKEE